MFTILAQFKMLIKKKKAKVRFFLTKFNHKNGYKFVSLIEIRLIGENALSRHN